MTTTEPTISPPVSPPAKRVKTDDNTPSMAETATAHTVPVTKMEQSPPLLIKKLSDKARLPTRGSAFAAGYDLYASKDTTIPARGKVLVDTDISMAVPAGTCEFTVPPPPYPPRARPTHHASPLSRAREKISKKKRTPF